MADEASVKIVKHFLYRGNPSKQWSNRYHFTGGSPVDLTHWTTLVNAIVTAEKATQDSFVGYDEAICYDPGSDLPLHTISLSGNGTATGWGGQYSPGDCAALIRWSTDQRTSKNHPVYLYSWMHNAKNQGGGSVDLLLAAQKSALETYAGAWETGFSDGTVTHKRCGPRGAVALGHFVSPSILHRDFPN